MFLEINAFVQILIGLDAAILRKSCQFDQFIFAMISIFY